MVHIPDSEKGRSHEVLQQQKQEPPGIDPIRASQHPSYESTGTCKCRCHHTRLWNTPICLSEILGVFRVRVRGRAFSRNPQCHCHGSRIDRRKPEFRFDLIFPNWFWNRIIMLRVPRWGSDNVPALKLIFARRYRYDAIGFDAVWRSDAARDFDFYYRAGGISPWDIDPDGNQPLHVRLTRHFDLRKTDRADRLRQALGI